MSISEWTFLAPVGLIQSVSLLGRPCTGLSLTELFHLVALARSCGPSRSDGLRRPPSPAHSGCRSLGRTAFTVLRVLLGRPTTRWAPLPPFACAYRVTSPGATRRPGESSWSHVLVFRPVPSAPTVVRWVDENAFAPILRARPCPTFGRPVRHRDCSHRLRPGTSPHALRIPPRGGHPALRSPASGGFRSALAVSGFRLCARIGFSIPAALSGQRGVTPAFGYSAPHPGAGGTSTLLTNALSSAHYGFLRPCAPHRYAPSREVGSLDGFPSHRDDRFPRSTREPGSDSRRIHVGHHPSRQQGSPRA